jgi:hypothetical protein
MTEVTVSLSPEASDRLARRAKRLRARPEDISKAILEAALREEPIMNKPAQEILADAGLLCERSGALAIPTAEEISLDEIRAALTVADGPTLSDIILEQRGRKD